MANSDAEEGSPGLGLEVPPGAGSWTPGRRLALHAELLRRVGHLPKLSRAQRSRFLIADSDSAMLPFRISIKTQLHGHHGQHGSTDGGPDGAGG